MSSESSAQASSSSSSKPKEPVHDPDSTSAVTPPPGSQQQEEDSVVFDTVNLISSDGFSFVISKEVAVGAGTIKSMLSASGQFRESVANEIKFRDIKAIILERICQYLYHKARYKNFAGEIPEFFVPVEHAYELLMAGEFLDT